MKLEDIKMRGMLFSDTTKQIVFSLADVHTTSRELNVVEVRTSYEGAEFTKTVMVTDVVASTGYEDAKGAPIFPGDHLKDNKGGKYYIIDSRGDLYLRQYEPTCMTQPFNKELASKLERYFELHPYQKKKHEGGKSMTALFRGKTMEGEWIIGYFMVDDDDYGTHLIKAPGKQWREVDAESVGQFTGLYDIDGIPIYVGDIMNRKVPIGSNYCVGHDDSEGRYELFFFVGDKKYIHSIPLNQREIEDSMLSVIGNETDNPELFEEGKEE